ncbi:hypothetical protein PYW07_000318 [Mythimna separata]|uniref:BPTI/Kunitz inhibitor domain-containing protein n=1 Tax=Mythimna separata TaxID=271217 RepID=A0AAD7Z2Q8_MYTSE|nr:hypothetical protein PYW07_000318 [Mythimna separata]
MFSKFYLIHILFSVGILDLYPSVLSYTDEVYESHELLTSGWDVRCKLQPNSWLCYRNLTSVVYRYYYDIAVKACKTFPYGGCALNFNGFRTSAECNSLCFTTEKLTPTKLKEISMNVSCRLQPDFGSCFGYFPSFYYDISTRTCKGFSYSGCGGNANRFANNMDCMDTCESLLPRYREVRPRRRKKRERTLHITFNYSIL